MNFAQHQRNPQRHLTGIAIVALFHIVLIYALANGLARKVVEVISDPLQVKLIEEVRTEPPPREVVPPPQFKAPPPPFIPPPEVQVTAPPQTPVIAAVVTTPPSAPAPVRAPEPQQIASAPQVVNVGVVCPNHLDVRGSVPYPPQALRLHMSGDVLVEFTVAESGQIKDVSITKSTNQIFNAVASNAVSRFNCSSPGREVRVRVPFEFKVG